jgi:hypothetical protein
MQIQINAQNYKNIFHNHLTICCLMYIDTEKIQHTNQQKKYLWLYTFIVLCIFFKIEACDNIPLQSEPGVKTFITSINLALRKVIKPLSGFFSQKIVSIKDSHKNIGFFSLMGITLRAGYLNRFLNTIYKQPISYASITQIPRNDLIEQQDTQIPGYIKFAALTEATIRTLRKISQPNTYINIQRPWISIQAHPKISIFSIFTAAVAGIVFHSRHSAQFFKHVHDAEKQQHIRHELQETQQQIQQAQEAAATLSTQELLKQTEC